MSGARKTAPSDPPAETGLAGLFDLDSARVLRDTLACAVLTLDSRRRITGINSQAEKLLGLNAESALGQTADILPEPLRQLIQGAIAGGRPLTEQVVVLRDARRGELVLQLGSNPIAQADGQVSGVVVWIHDLTAAQKLEAGMRALDRLHNAGTLSAGLAHEVKNAFVAVKTFVDLLLEKNPGSDLAEIVRLELARIDTLLRRMRQFSKPVATSVTPLQVHPLLEKSLQLVQPLLEDRRLRLTRAFHASADTVNGNSAQLEQAFINLLFNALEAMSEGGELHVATQLQPPGVQPGEPARASGPPFLRIQIRDSGAGISPQNLEKLFEPFFTTKTDGTGLGLAITRRIILEHGGHISVASEVNRGTEFTILLPAS